MKKDAALTFFYSCFYLCFYNDFLDFQISKFKFSDSKKRDVLRDRPFNGRLFRNYRLKYAWREAVAAKSWFLD